MLILFMLIFIQEQDHLNKNLETQRIKQEQVTLISYDLELWLLAFFNTVINSRVLIIRQ